MNPRYPYVADRAAHRCEYCRANEAVFNFPFEVEHIIPPGHGGPDDETNWALSCRACNLRKSDHIHATDPLTQETVALFHPRQHWWHDHFRADADTGEIVGLTPIGRATVVRLQVNCPVQIAARKQWVRLGLFP